MTPATASPEESAQTASKIAAPKTRFVSIDAIRGFDMFWILGGDRAVRSLVNIHDSSSTRGLAVQMEHCEWAGFHFYDLIFPLFVFIVGVSIVFSLTKIIEQQGRAAAIKRIAVRSIVLFALGVFYMGGVSKGFSNMYFAGVLHRIAVAYFFAALIFCFFRLRAMIGICAGLLVLYWALMTFVPVPGIGHPTLAEPGHNLAHYLDERFLPGQRFEGTLLSTLAAVANCLLGVFAGLLLKNQRMSEQRKVGWLTLAGILSLIAGFAWSLNFPIIKLLWTSSYVLVACGYAALLLALFHQIITIWGWQKWARPFIWIGMNALTIYIICNIVSLHRLALRLSGGDIAAALGNWSDFVNALVGLALVFWLARFLYRRQVFLRL